MVSDTIFLIPAPITTILISAVWHAGKQAKIRTVYRVLKFIEY
jgi:hypothetical protein